MRNSVVEDTSSQKKPVVAIRQKASSRKGRSTDVKHVARLPLQERSKQRFQRILDAASTLLGSYNIEDISVYDIARQAELPAASVSYLFPTMASLHIELSKKYNALCVESVEKAMDELAAARNPSWQDWLIIAGNSLRGLFNQDRAFCEVALGPLLHREVRLKNVRSLDKTSAATIDAWSRTFVLPEIPNLAQHCAFSAEIADALWSRSYIVHGRINDDEFNESMRMQISYLRNFLPETLALIPGTEFARA